MREARLLRPVDTDLFNFSRSVERELEGEVFLVDGLRRFPRAYAMCPLRVAVGRQTKRTISVPRAFWAIAHPESHLAADTYLIHECDCHGARAESPHWFSRVCIELSHLRVLDTRAFAEWRLKQLHDGYRRWAC